MLNKLIKNLIFAINFDVKVPEHIMEEIFCHKKSKNKSGSAAYGGDALTSTFRVIEPEVKIKVEAEPEPDHEAEIEIGYGTLTEFNAEVDKKIKGIQKDEDYKGFRIGENYGFPAQDDEYNIPMDTCEPENSKDVYINNRKPTDFDVGAIIHM